MSSTQSRTFAMFAGLALLLPGCHRQIQSSIFKDIPLAPQATVTMSQETGSLRRVEATVANDKVEELLAYYRTELPKQGWNLRERSSGAGHIIGASRPGYPYYSITVGPSRTEAGKAAMMIQPLGAAKPSQ
jgi:hypothetical protein